MDIADLSNLTAARVRELLDFSTDPPTWRVKRLNGCDAGDIAGSVDPQDGYRRIRVDGRLYKAHRLAWLAHTGCWPAGDIDHLNHDKSDNRPGNLRDVTRIINMQNQIQAPSGNRSSGLLGVSRYGNRWGAKITVDRKIHRLGRFATPEQAHAAYLEAKRKLHPGNTL